MSEDKPRSESTIPWVLTQVTEKVSDIRFALNVISAFIVLDIGLSMGTESSALTYDWGELDASKYKELALIFLAYLCWMAVFSKGLRPFAEMVALPFSKLIFRRGSDSSLYESYLRYGKVPVSEAMNEALAEENEFWIKRIDAAESEADTQKKRMDSLAGLSFSTVCLAAFDFGLAPKSFAGELIAQFQAGHYLVPTAALSFVLIALLVWLSHIPANLERTQTWIEHPELAKKLLTRQKERDSLSLRF